MLHKIKINLITNTKAKKWWNGTSYWRELDP